MHITTKDYVFICFIGSVVLIHGTFLYYINNRTIEPFSPSDLSSDLYNNERVMTEYNDCFATENNVTSLELQRCKLRASKSWFTRELDEANCNLVQVKAIEVACEPIIAPYRKKQ